MASRDGSTNAANWTASGATDSTLPGLASAQNYTATYNVKAGLGSYFYWNNGPQMIGTTSSNIILYVSGAGSLANVDAGTYYASKAIQQGQGTLTHAGTTTLDFNGATTDNYMVMTGAVTLLPANLATNRNYSLTLFWPGITNAPLYWPTNADGTSAMNWQGYAPTNIWPTNKTFTLLFKARGANNTNVTAVFGGQY